MNKHPITPKEKLFKNKEIVQAAVRAYTQENLSVREIAQRYHVSRSTMRQVLMMAGVKVKRYKKRYTQTDLDSAVRDYVTSAESLQQVASMYPFGYSTLYNHLIATYGKDYREKVSGARGKRRGRKGHSTDFKLEVANEYLSTSKTLQEVAIQFNVSVTTVSIWAKEIDKETYELAKGSAQKLLLAQEILEARPTIRQTELAELVDVMPSTIFVWRSQGKIQMDIQCVICGEPTTTKYCQPCRDKGWDYYANKYPKVTYSDLLSMPNHCEMCGVTNDLRIDHNHTTGEYRGVLCHGCNVGIGFLKEDIETLRKGIKYLTKKG